MRQITMTSNEMPKYIYMTLPSGEADVFICKPTGNVLEEGFEYETNEFRTKKLSESEISANPYSYLDYEEKEPTVEEKIKEIDTLKEQNQMLIDCLLEMADIIYA